MCLYIYAWMSTFRLEVAPGCRCQVRSHIHVPWCWAAEMAAAASASAHGEGSELRWRVITYNGQSCRRAGRWHGHDLSQELVFGGLSPWCAEVLRSLGPGTRGWRRTVSMPFAPSCRRKASLRWTRDGFGHVRIGIRNRPRVEPPFSSAGWGFGG